MNFNIRSRRDFDKSRLGYFWNGLHESSVYIDLVRQMFSKANSGRRDIRKAKWAPRHLEPSTWREDAAPVSLVVTCHIYYEDFLPEFLNLLSKIELPFDLMVTTPNKKVFLQLEALNPNFLGNLGERIIRLVPNRGRNFGPLLVEFGHEIANKYEYMLHIHSKKSLHTQFLNGWAEYLFMRLLPSDKPIKTIINQFRNGSDVGLIFPPYYEYLGFLRDPWDNNRISGDAWLAKNNFEESCEDFTFPAGGMFWARVRAIAPLLEADWEYEDFAPEESPTRPNFQTAYMVERLVGIVSEKSGFRNLYSTENGFTYDDSFKDRGRIFGNFFNRLLARNLRPLNQKLS